MASLYEIDKLIIDCVDGETGEIFDVERLEALQLDRAHKIENIALFYKNLISDAEQYKAEKEKFIQREKTAKNKAERLKQYLDDTLSGAAFKTIRVDVKYRASEVVIVEAVDLLDKKFLRHSEPTVDKDAIKKTIKGGGEVDGAHIEKRLNISIK